MIYSGRIPQTFNVPELRNSTVENEDPKGLFDV
jgi:hypothetical protein